VDMEHAEIWQEQPMNEDYCVKQRVKFPILGVETASNGFHPLCQRLSLALYRGQSRSVSITSAPNQCSRVLSAIGDNCWVKRSASRRFGLEQAT